MPAEASDLTEADLHVGRVEEFERSITEADILAFATVSGDRNPLHVDADYARTTNYQGRIVHGAFQVGLASAMAGMYVPGRRCLLGAIHARFIAPLAYPCTVRVRGVVKSWQPATRRGQLEVAIIDTARAVPVSEIGCSFTLHTDPPSSSPAALDASTGPLFRGGRSSGASGDADLAGGSSSPHGPAVEEGRSEAEVPGRPVVLVTGASGGVGAAIVGELARDHRVVALVHRNPLPDVLAARGAVVGARAGLDDPGWPARVIDALAGAPLSGVVHAAWPGAPRGGLLDAQPDVVDRQLTFATHHTIALARFLRDHVGEAGGSMVVLGSTFGSAQPNLGLAAYSLGKATLEGAVRLLAPELARSRVTINAVCPAVVPVGLNKELDERHRLRLAARVPMARLCTPLDVAGMVRYLLSAPASFVSGQSIVLSGGAL